MHPGVVGVSVGRPLGRLSVPRSFALNIFIVVAFSAGDLDVGIFDTVARIP